MAGTNHTNGLGDRFSNIWITLITRSSYLPGVVLLIHSLYKHESAHPILVQYTPQLLSDNVDCLRSLQRIYPLLRIQLVEPIGLPDGLIPVAKRFDDTLTKLRAFQPFDDPSTLRALDLPHPPTQACFLDADILIMRNMDDIFDVPRPDPSRTIAASHACVCNLDYDPWAGEDWNPTNCAFTSLAQRSENNHHSHDRIDNNTLEEGSKPTHRLCNSGVFVFSPSRELWSSLERFRATDPRVLSFHFPDQNFLDNFFSGDNHRHHRVELPWYFNAVKTLRYRHPQLWRDDEVRALHYIVDKPWAKRIGEDGVAGFKGRDGETHAWWWEEFEHWEREMGERGDVGREVLGRVRGEVAGPLKG